MQVKGPSLTNEHSGSGITKMSEQVSAITARHLSRPWLLQAAERDALISDEGEQ
jgi:hypothetical protein